MRPSLVSQDLQLEAAADSMDHQVVAGSAAGLAEAQWVEELVQDARFMFPTFVPFPCDLVWRE